MSQVWFLRAALVASSLSGGASFSGSLLPLSVPGARPVSLASKLGKVGRMWGVSTGVGGLVAEEGEHELAHSAWRGIPGGRGRGAKFGGGFGDVEGGWAMGRRGLTVVRSTGMRRAEEWRKRGDRRWQAENEKRVTGKGNCPTLTPYPLPLSFPLLFMN